jgi:hypothetical protein
VESVDNELLIIYAIDPRICHMWNALTDRMDEHCGIDLDIIWKNVFNF